VRLNLNYHAGGESFALKGAIGGMNVSRKRMQGCAASSFGKAVQILKLSLN
jgi:hypothetical protein